MRITVTNKTELLNVSQPLEKEIRRNLTLKNPAYTDAEKMGRLLQTTSKGTVTSLTCCFQTFLNPSWRSL